MPIIKRFYITGLLIIIALAGLTSCNDDDAHNPNIDANNWIYDVMKEVYYWTDEIPANVNRGQDPSNFFHQLLSDDDRFSAIVPDYQELKNALSGVSKEAGYEFALARVENSNDVVAIILYVKKDSPADDAGLKRGDVISQINGTTITIDNYRQLISETYNNHSIKYKRYSEESDEYIDKGTLTLNAVVVSENPNFMDTVYAVGSKKIGYYVYNFFSPGTNKTTVYDNEMDQVIANFKSQGIDALILDLRYNSGGAVTSAQNLASLVGSGVNSSKIFYKNQYNDLYQNYFNNQPDGDEALRAHFLDKAENIGNEIGGELYILTGSRTASASELIINGLDPYMHVTIIGDTTVGKNVGSFPIENTKDPNIHYGLLPIVFKIFNSQDYSGYDNGFTPLGENLVNDFRQPMLQLGDIQEPLLARAIELIEGTSVGGRKPRIESKEFTPIMTSIDKKRRTNRLIIEGLKSN
ncbi:Carboxyl-terminal protease [Fulvivirga imtechensis AK7]|uniref:Carboxyl-terminal protease n=1 Tax=Fulvivirga imtechensis AK7 TaxID=1237149 RepID=L8JL31_9BACT|nr:S41 family peptidase [Fulvivirga imtechensis]ELR68933.1 Carboxyl-terminal protease [Fulvivirga imtechensis AK7]